MKVDKLVIGDALMGPRRDIVIVIREIREYSGGGNGEIDYFEYYFAPDGGRIRRCQKTWKQFERMSRWTVVAMTSEVLAKLAPLARTRAALERAW